jgi:hypothetical protein
VSGPVELLRLLRRVRRRLRARAAAEGIQFGCCAFLAGWAWFVRESIAGGKVPPKLSLFAWAAAGIGLGALAGAARRIPLRRCARKVDETVGRTGGEPRNGDRTVAALALVDGGAAGPFVEAAVADALRAAGPAAPVRAAPWRRPRGIRVAVGLTAVAVIAALWPRHRAPAAAMAPRAPVVARRAPIDPRTFALDRRAADEATRRAAALGDDTLGRLAQELRRVMAGLESGSLERGEALERLDRLAAEAREAARDGAAMARGLRAAGEALSSERQAADLAAALRALDEQASGKAAQELASRAGELGARQREQLGRALSRAAAAAGDPRGESAASNQRRLSSPSGNEPAGQGGSRSDERQLKSLSRDMEGGAEACKQSPEACKRALGQAGERIPPMARQGQRSASRDQLGRALEQMRERLRRLDPGERNPEARESKEAEQDFERAVGGAMASGAGEGGEPGGETTPAGQGSGAPAGAMAAHGQGEGEGASASAAGPAGTPAGATAGGDGIGKDPGGDPLGSREGDGATRGETHQAKVRSGAGPSRAEVIEAGARRGFARAEYHRVFDDYSAVVEETLDTTAVPPARRYLVRRYFELIRPRAGEPGGRP